MIALSDGIEWQEGQPVYWFGIYQVFGEIGFKLVMYKEMPLKATMSDNELVFMFPSRQKSQYGYYSNYQSAMLALTDASKKEYKNLMARQLETMRAIKDAANNNNKKLSFSFEGMINEFTSDEIDILKKHMKV